MVHIPGATNVVADYLSRMSDIGFEDDNVSLSRFPENLYHDLLIQEVDQDKYEPSLQAIYNYLITGQVIEERSNLFRKLCIALTSIIVAYNWDDIM